MPLVDPAPPTFDPATWPRLPFRARLRLASQDRAVNGFGAPVSAYPFSLPELVLYATDGDLIGRQPWPDASSAVRP